MSREHYLLDKSALARWPRPAVAPVLDELSDRGLLAVCGAVEIEVLHSARTAKEAQRARWLLHGFDWLAMPDDIWDRAIDVQVQALHKGTHRALSMADLLVAATAERHGATVLHYDGDFDMITSITGQPTTWVVPAGTAD
ncbi:PIN domain nuclease [Micromonospora echinofusca]|uniref:Ribonuclease VapC n=1 Tax=Micromonospora echinofusca TaxID=47858 RepID=A0ABS3W0U0_MICEH|nr:PIN domain nuclease [Micromonospora echinofusca]MBO4210229.1 PIN domain-containing protein [Micromonospora echinofusca]